jgi:hypothetical protein
MQVIKSLNARMEARKSIPHAAFKLDGKGFPKVSPLCICECLDLSSESPRAHGIGWSRLSLQMGVCMAAAVLVS